MVAPRGIGIGASVSCLEDGLRFVVVGCVATTVMTKPFSVIWICSMSIPSGSESSFVHAHGSVSRRNLINLLRVVQPAAFVCAGEKSVCNKEGRYEEYLPHRALCVFEPVDALA